MADMNPEEIIRLTQLLSEFNKITENASKAVENLKKEIDDGNKTAEVRNELLKKQTELEEAEIKRAATLIEFSKLSKTQREAAVEILKQEAQETDKIISANDVLIKKYQDIQTNIEEKVKKQKKGTEVGQKELEQAADAAIKAKELIEKNKALKEAKDKQIEQQQFLNEGAKEEEVNTAKKILQTNDLNQSIRSLTASISQSIAGQAGLNSQYNQQIMLANQAGGATGMLKMSLAGLTQGFLQAFNPISMFSTVLANSVSNFQRFYETMAKMGRELGTTVTAGFNTAAAAGARMGIEAGQQAATVNSLGTAFVNLGNKQREQTTQLLIASYEMQRFGIGTSESISILSAFDRSLGYSTESSAKMATTLIHTSRHLGLTSDAVKALANNMNSFVVYGSRANEIMKETLEVSSKFGIGADAIAKMGEKLDSLDATLAVSRTLARDFGVALDHIALMRANPAEKMEMLAKALQNVNIHTDAGRFKIRNLADSMGLTAQETMALMNQIENGSNKISGMEKNIRGLDESFQKLTGGQTLDGLAQLKVLLESASKPLMLMLGAFNALFGAVIGFFNWGFAKLNEFGTIFGVGFGDMAASLAVFGLAWWKMGSMVISTSGALSGALGTVSAGLVSAGTAIGTFFMEIGAGAALAVEGIPFILAFGAAILLVGAGIALAAWGAAEFVKSFKGLGASELLSIVAALYLLGTSFGSVSVGLMSLANPLTAIGLGIFTTLMITIGAVHNELKSFADSIKELSNMDLVMSAAANIRTVYEAFGEGGDILPSKIKPVVDMSNAMKVYADAVTQFGASGGAANSTAMVNALTEAITTINNQTVTNTTTTTEGGGFGNGSVNIYLGDELVVGSAFATIARTTISKSARTPQ